jgi:hypothetical protein
VKYFVSMVAASLIGTLLGFCLAPRPVTVNAADSPRIETRELVLLGDHDKPAARLVARNGGAILQFYDSQGSTAVEVGFDASQQFRFLSFLDHNGWSLASLNSSPPKGESSLVLGDQTFIGRMIIGAIRSDVPSTTIGTDEWGIEIRRPGHVVPVVSIMTGPGSLPSKWRGGIYILRENGKAWTAPN